jgi:hypothetical protein
VRQGSTNCCTSTLIPGWRACPASRGSRLLVKKMPLFNNHYILGVEALTISDLRHRGSRQRRHPEQSGGIHPCPARISPLQKLSFAVSQSPRAVCRLGAFSSPALKTGCSMLSVGFYPCHPCHPCHPWFLPPSPLWLVTRSIHLPAHRPAGFALMRIIANSCKNTFPHGDGLSVARYRPRE